MSRVKSYRAATSSPFRELTVLTAAAVLLPFGLVLTLGIILDLSSSKPVNLSAERNITAQAATTELPPQANALERLTNEQRESNGLPALATNELLRQSACHKAADMVKHGYFAHVAPDGTEPWHYFREAGYEYQHAGENLARNFTDDAALVQAWMDSPTHRDNVLGDFEEQGICSVEGVTVQHLGSAS